MCELAGAAWCPCSICNDMPADPTQPSKYSDTTVVVVVVVVVVVETPLFNMLQHYSTLHIKILLVLLVVVLIVEEVV